MKGGIHISNGFYSGATTNTAVESAALDDIDANDTGVSDADFLLAHHTLFQTTVAQQVRL